MIVRGVEFPPVAARVLPDQVFADGKEPQRVEVTHAELSAQGARAMNRSMYQGLGRRRLPFYFEPKAYTVMRINGRVWMSDHPSEVFESAPAVENARGDVFVAGLGLGVILPPLLARSEVRSVTVLEKSWAVRRLIAKAYASEPKLEIVAGDAWTWKPPRQYDSVWLDIWEDCAIERMAEVLALCRRWRGFRRADGWLGAWNLAEMRVLRASERFKGDSGDRQRRRRILASVIAGYGGGQVLNAILAKDWLRRHEGDLWAISC